ncbi:MAG: DoxX family protein [Pseudomonadales bacterium]|nr:DoxX family protein [Pseudomonadales bacterium]
MEKYENYGATVLRIALGIIFLAHSAYLKIVVFTVPGTVGFFESLGLPAISAYLVIGAEIVGGVLLILGIRVRETAAVLAAVALGATWAHAGAGWVFSNEGGGWEYPLFLAVTCFVQVLLGAGELRVRLPQPQAQAEPV